MVAHYGEHTAAWSRQFAAALPSGRWQARYKGPDGIDRPAPHTFDSKTSAERWLILTEAEIIQGGWTNLDAGRILFSQYARDWIEERPDLRPKTVRLYRYLLRCRKASVRAHRSGARSA